MALGTQRGWAVVTDRPWFLCLGREKEARGHSGTGLATPHPQCGFSGPELPCGDTAALRGTHIWEDRWSGRRDSWFQCRPCHILAPRPWGFLGDLSGAPVHPVKWEGDPNDGGCLSQVKVLLVRLDSAGWGALGKSWLCSHRTGMWQMRSALRRLEKSLVFCQQAVCLALPPLELLRGSL